MEVVEKLIQAGADVNEQDWRGVSPLHAASLKGHLQVVVKLIQTGGAVKMLIGDGWNPLPLASNYGHVEVITALLAAGADKTIKDGFGRTPHDRAKNQYVLQECPGVRMYFLNIRGGPKCPIFVPYLLA